MKTTAVPILRGHVGPPNVHFSHSAVGVLICIHHAVAQAFRRTPQELTQRTHQARIAQPRQVALYLAAKQGLDWLDIAEYWGLDSTTVGYACRTVRDRMEVDPRFRAQVERLRAATDCVAQ